MLKPSFQIPVIKENSQINQQTENLIKNHRIQDRFNFLLNQTKTHQIFTFVSSKEILWKNPHVEKMKKEKRKIFFRVHPSYMNGCVQK